MRRPIIRWSCGAVRRASSGVPGAHGTFGTTVFSSSGFRGDIYFLKPGTAKLPRFERGKPVGSVYTNVLQVPARDFREGFPGTDRQRSAEDGDASH